MPVPALPDYVGKQDLSTASPGMRFGMYLSIWNSREDQEKQIRDQANKKSPQALALKRILDTEGMEAAIHHFKQNRGKLEKLWAKNDSVAKDVWRKVAAIRRDDKVLLEALVNRQNRLAESQQNVLTVYAESVAPFTTGLGNEHPLENGFAFLWPYGLPYLPGSGVKGVLRQAARELAKGEWGETYGWDDKTIQILFGSDNKDHPLRGALVFWDVFPCIQGTHLHVEVMTGHQSHYYMKDGTPHDSGKPNPVFFLTVPTGATFTFHVTCDIPFLRAHSPELEADGCWQTMLEKAFAHAFAWLGFGAKTAVGYGMMKTDDSLRERHIRQQLEMERVRKERAAQQKAERERQLAAMDPVERKICEYESLEAAIKALEQGEFGEAQVKAAEYIKARMQKEKCWVEKSMKKRPEKDKNHQRTLRVMKYLQS